MIFTNRYDAILGSKIEGIQMKKMDLHMHVGIGDTQFQTEAICVPTRENI